MTALADRNTITAFDKDAPQVRALKLDRALRATLRQTAIQRLADTGIRVDDRKGLQRLRRAVGAPLYGVSRLVQRGTDVEIILDVGIIDQGRSYAAIPGIRSEGLGITHDGKVHILVFDVESLGGMRITKGRPVRLAEMLAPGLPGFGLSLSTRP